MSYIFGAVYCSYVIPFNFVFVPKNIIGFINKEVFLNINSKL